MTLREKYLENHLELLDHYVGGAAYGGHYLVFKEDFRAALPQKTGNGIDEVTVNLIDTEDGNKIYQMGWWLNYEEEANEQVLDKNIWEQIPVFTLSQYIYGSKLCPCNIKMGAKQAGAIVEDDECEGKRFQIQSIVFDDHPDLILYSETYDMEQLESILIGGTPP